MPEGVEMSFETSYDRQKIKELAARMLPDLMARRFALGMGNTPEEVFVEMAMRLAARVYRSEVPRA